MLAKRRPVRQQNGAGNLADGVDGPAQGDGGQGGQDDPGQGAGQHLAPAGGPQDHHGHHQQAHGHGGPVRRKAALKIAHQFQRRRLGPRRLHPQEVVDLPHGDDHGDPRRKAGDHGRGDKGNKAAQFQQAHHQNQRPGHHPGDPGRLQPIAHGDHDQNGAHGPGRPGDLVGRAGEGADDQPAEDGGHQPGRGAGPGGHAKGQGQGQGHRGHGQPGQQILAEDVNSIAGELPPVELYQRETLHQKRPFGDTPTTQEKTRLAKGDRVTNTARSGLFYTRLPVGEKVWDR